MSIQEKLKLLGRLTGYTQTRLAAELGVSFPTFNSWVNGKSAPHPKTVQRIEEFYLRQTGANTVSPEQLADKRKEITRFRRTYPDVLRILTARQDIHDQYLLSFTYNTNRIEGSTLTEPETAAVLFQSAGLKDKTLVEQMEVKNHQAAFGHMLRHAHAGDDITEEFILRLHGMLMNGIRSDAGEYRTHGVRIVGSPVPTANHLSIPKRMGELIADIAAAKADDTGTATAVHSRFEQIHPFSDGNGRLGRLLLAAMLLRGGFAPAIVRQELKRFYLMYLQQAQMDGDCSRLEDFMLDGILFGYGIIDSGTDIT